MESLDYQSVSGFLACFCDCHSSSFIAQLHLTTPSVLDIVFYHVHDKFNFILPHVTSSDIHLELNRDSAKQTFAWTLKARLILCFNYCLLHCFQYSRMYILWTGNNSIIFTKCSSQAKIKWIASRVGYDSTSSSTRGVVLEFSTTNNKASVGSHSAHPDFSPYPVSASSSTATILRFEEFVECDECEDSKDPRRWTLDVGVEADRWIWARRPKELAAQYLGQILRTEGEEGRMKPDGSEQTPSFAFWLVLVDRVSNDAYPHRWRGKRKQRIDPRAGNLLYRRWLTMNGMSSISRFIPEQKVPLQCVISQVEWFDYACLSLAVFTDDLIVREGGADNDCYEDITQLLLTVLLQNPIT